MPQINSQLSNRSISSSLLKILRIVFVSCFDAAGLGSALFFGWTASAVFISFSPGASQILIGAAIRVSDLLDVERHAA